MGEQGGGAINPLGSPFNGGSSRFPDSALFLGKSIRCAQFLLTLHSGHICPSSPPPPVVNHWCGGLIAISRQGFESAWLINNGHVFKSTYISLQKSWFCVLKGETTQNQTFIIRTKNRGFSRLMDFPAIFVTDFLLGLLPPYCYLYFKQICRNLSYPATAAETWL